VPTYDLLNSFAHKFIRFGNTGTQLITISVYILIAVLSVDTIINQISGALGIPFSGPVGISSFVILSSMVIVCQLFVLYFVSKVSLGIRKKIRHIKRMHHAVTISQYSIIIIFIFVMLEIVLTQQYSPISPFLVTMISYGLSISLMGIFTVIFLSWYWSNRSSILVLLYGLSFATVVIASLAILLVWIYIFGEKLSLPILPTSEVSFPSTEEGSIWKFFGKVYQYSDIASFFLKWGGTILILYHYSSKLGKTKFWFLLSLPMAYFSTLLALHFHIYEPHGEMESLVFIGIVALNSTFGGILFYLAFKLTSENFESNEQIRNYLLMAGFGFMLFFSGTQSSLTSTAFPPFGFATLSSYGLGSYLILLGLYLSALSVSQDEQLRSMIKKSTLSESKFLHSIGTAAGEQEKEMVNTVLNRVRKQQERVAKDTGIVTSLSEEEIKDFVKDIENKKT